MYQNPNTSIFYRYIDLWTGVDKKSITRLLFFSVNLKWKWGVAKW